ncbi:EI24 domain-containing protein [Rhodospirillaceae bacterium SYSU D60014]|uniref:EI24 domain-containing protein n=1 Tax=Virgifigura deserti TaxID=2268457 RepID=UPI0013C40986
MLSVLIKAFAQLTDPRARRYVWLSLGGAIAVLVALVIVIWLAAFQLQFVSLGWLDTVIDVGAGLGAILLAWLLFPVSVLLIVGFFLEDVAEAVEARHYPDLPEARSQSVGEAVLSSARFAGLALLLNLLALPLIIVLFFFPPFNLFVFYGLNGYLLGREYFELVALRRLDPRQVRALRQAHRGRLFLGGVVIAFLSTVPVINFVAPVVATAFMLHLFEALRRRQPQRVPPGRAA